MTDQDPSDLINQGDRLFEQGNYRAALSCYTQAADLACRSGQTSTELAALSRLSVCWGSLGESNKMAETAARLLARAKQLNNPTYQMEAGLRLAEALANIDLPTRWPEIRLVLLENLQTARQLENDFWIVYHLAELGYRAQQMGDNNAAYAWLQDALNVLTPTTERSAFFRARIYHSFSAWAKDQGEREEALRYAEMAVGAARERGRLDVIAEAQRHLARVQRWRGERAEALALVEDALATSRQLNYEDDIVEALALKTKLLSELSLVELTQATYDELWAMKIQNPDHYKEIGPVAYKTIRNLADAERAFRLFLEARPTHPDGHSKLALVLYDQGDVTAAVRAWREALTYREQHPDALAGLALGLWTLNERAEALTIFGQALALRPQVADPAYLDEEFDWSKQAVEAVQPLLVASAGRHHNGL